jgi:phenylacetate-CoA ligase
MRGISWGGLGLRQKHVLLTGHSLSSNRPPPRLAGLRSWLIGVVPLSGYDLGSPGIIGKYAKVIRRSGARFLVGYASACYLLATLAQQSGEKITLEAVYPTSELCPPDWAETMNKVFSAKVLPFYGCGEVNSLGHTCPQGGVYHSCDEHAVIEAEDDQGGASLEGEGAFLITDLDNRAVPYIRYRNGDVGRLAGAGCPCGRSLGRIVELHGRVNDMLVTSQGARVSGMVAANAFLAVRRVECFQVVQQRPGQVCVRVVRQDGYDAASAEAHLNSFFRQFLGGDAKVEIEYVESIPLPKSGKRRFVINEYLASQNK